MHEVTCQVSLRYFRQVQSCLRERSDQHFDFKVDMMPWALGAVPCFKPHAAGLLIRLTCCAKPEELLSPARDNNHGKEREIILDCASLGDREKDAEARQDRERRETDCVLINLIPVGSGVTY